MKSAGALLMVSLLGACAAASGRAYAGQPGRSPAVAAANGNASAATDSGCVWRKGEGQPPRGFPRTPPPYGDDADWFRNLEPVVLHGRTYYPYGQPMVIPVRRYDAYRGIPVYVQATFSGPGMPDMLFVPVRPGCTFVPFNYSNEGRPVRG